MHSPLPVRRGLRVLLLLAMATLMEISGRVSAQDGGRSFSFKTDDQYRQENWTAAGTARGFFGWTDNNGEGIDIEFIADENGYRVIKKKNKLNVLSRQPRTKLEFDEFEFGDEEDDGSAYRFAYNTGTSFREEVKRGGVIFGKYGFITADNKLHVTYYSASKKRGFVPIREIRDPSEMAAIYAEPAKPVPIRRLRSLASPPDLLPDTPVFRSTARNTTFVAPTVKAPTVHLQSSQRQSGKPSSGVTPTVLTPTVKAPTVQLQSSQRATPAVRAPTVQPHSAALPSVKTPSEPPPAVRNPTVKAPTVQPSGKTSTPPQTVQIPRVGISTPPKSESKTAPKANAVIPRMQRGPLAHSAPRGSSSQQFSYNLGRNFHEQSKEADGVSGKYGWKDAHGRLHEIHYVADSQGYKVVARKLKSNSTINKG